MATLAKVKKGETVMLCVFTGMKIGPKEVVACDKSTITIHHNGKGDMVFERKTGKLIKPLPNNPKFSSFITEDDGTFVPPNHKKKAKSTKAATKKAKPEPEVEPEEDDEEETPEPKKTRAKKPTPNKTPKKKQPEPEEDEDFDEDDFEEVE